MAAAVLVAVLVPASVIAATANDVPAWVDSISRVGVIGLLALAFYALHRGWWVPGRFYRELEQRHSGCVQRYDEAIEVALQSARGVQRSATVLEHALAEQGRG